MSLYKAFGLKIESPVELPEMLKLSAGIPDVVVTLRSVDVSDVSPAANILMEHKWWQEMPTDSRTLFGCNAGVYEIIDGSQIAIDVAPDALPEMVRMFLLGSALGAVQIQRGRIPVHGGAVVSRGRAVIITGVQGAGKSTMTSALVYNGFKYLTDDVSSIEFSGDGLVVHSAYPQRKLVRDACITFGFNPEGLPVVDTERDKFAIRDRDNWYEESVRLGMLVELVPADEGDGLHSEKIGGHACLSLVIRNLYRMWMHMQDGVLPPTEFKKMLTIASKLDAHRVYVPRDIEHIPQFARELADELGMSP